MDKKYIAYTSPIFVGGLRGAFWAEGEDPLDHSQRRGAHGFPARDAGTRAPLRTHRQPYCRAAGGCESADSDGRRAPHLVGDVWGDSVWSCLILYLIFINTVDPSTTVGLFFSLLMCGTKHSV